MKEPFIKKLKAPLYRTPIWVIVHPSISKAIDFVEDKVDFPLESRKQKGEGRSTMATAISLEDPQGCQRVFLFLRPSSKPGEIAHECKHTLNRIFQWYGVRLSVTNDESECYYLDWLVDHAHSVINKYKKANKKVSKKLDITEETVIFTS